MKWVPRLGPLCVFVSVIVMVILGRDVMAAGFLIAYSLATLSDAVIGLRRDLNDRANIRIHFRP